MRVDRRRFLAAMAITAACGGPAEQPTEEAAVEEPFSTPLGAQLYTLRSILPDNAAQVLKDLAAIGYEEVGVRRARAIREGRRPQTQIDASAARRHHRRLGRERRQA
jgi:hypothetical protein